MSHSSHIHSYPPQRKGVAALPYAEILASSTEASICQYRNRESHFVRADTAVRPYAEHWLSRPSFDNHPGTKKRRMHCIVVSRLPALFEQLMLLHYQTGLDFASGVESQSDDRITNRATDTITTIFSRYTRSLSFNINASTACRIHRILKGDLVHTGKRRGMPLRVVV